MRENLPALVWDARNARAQGAAGIRRRQRARLAELVTYARTHSPFYRRLYQDLPERVDDPSMLPVVDKKTLMTQFDDWVTDPAVNLDQARAFAADPDLVGRRFCDTYALTTTSGTTGAPGIFLHDRRSLTVASALAVRMVTAWLGVGDFARIVRGGRRVAMVIAAGGHFASATAAARLRATSPRRAERIGTFSVHEPLPDLVAALNRFQPAILAPYASVGALLAGEAEAGRLRIKPVLVMLAAEGLPSGEYDRITHAFGAKVGHSYAANECPFLSYNCPDGWLHVNNDWAVLEPVDADHRPTPAGEQSHTVLISNLANRIQPILRYDLGDSVLARPDPCPCGNPLPAIRVKGRAADLLTFSSGNGQQISIAPLALATLAEATPGVDRFQIIQPTPNSLRLRLQTAADAEPATVRRELHTRITRLLTDHELGHISLDHDDEPPRLSSGGKHRAIIPLKVPPDGVTPPDSQTHREGRSRP